MYLQIHPSGLDREWMLFRVPDRHCRIVRTVAAEYTDRTGNPAIARSNRDARSLKSIDAWSKRDRYSSLRTTVIDDPSVFVDLFLRAND